MNELKDHYSTLGPILASGHWEVEGNASTRLKKAEFFDGIYNARRIYAQRNIDFTKSYHIESFRSYKDVLAAYPESDLYDGKMRYLSTYNRDGTLSTNIAPRSSIVPQMSMYIDTVPIIGGTHLSLIQRGALQFAGHESVPKWGDCYLLNGHDGTSNADIQLHVCPNSGFLVVQSEVTLFRPIVGKALRRVSYLDEAQGIGGLILPKTVHSDTFFYKDDFKVAKTITYHFDHVVVGNEYAPVFALPVDPGDHFTDTELNKHWRVRPNGERIYIDLTTKDTRRQMQFGWLFMASVTTLLVLTVGAYVRWKRNQLAKQS